MSVQGPTAHSVPSLTQKLYDADSDIRFMSLTDLHTIFVNSPTTVSILAQDYVNATKTVEGLMHTLADSNGEVQNMTIKVLGAMVNKTHEKILAPLIDRISTLDVSESVDSSVSALALRAIVVALPRPSGNVHGKDVLNAYDAVSTVLIPRLLGTTSKVVTKPSRGLLIEDMESNNDRSAIDILNEVARCFGPMLRAEEVDAMQQAVNRILKQPNLKPSFKKKAVMALATLAHYFTDARLKLVVLELGASMFSSSNSNHRLYLGVFASLSRAVPSKFGLHLPTVFPLVLGELDQTEDDEMESDDDEVIHTEEDEIREAALLAIDSFVVSCPADAKRFYDDSFDAALRFLKYDPNVTDDDQSEDDEAIADDDFEVDDDFEEEEGINDEDDISWKVRRCAARLLFSLVSARGPDLLEDGARVKRLMKTLVKQTQDREDAVKLEVLRTLSFTIRTVGDSPNTTLVTNGVETTSKPRNRKRRRGLSDVTMNERPRFTRITGSASPEAISDGTGPAASLVDYSAEIYQANLKLLQSGNLQVRPAALNLIKDLIVAQQGQAQEYLSSICSVVIECANSGNSSFGALGSSSSVQVQALQLASEIAKNHSSTVLHNDLGRLVEPVLAAVQGKMTIVACEALNTTEQIVKVYTPPRNARGGQKSVELLKQIYSSIYALAASRATDLTVRNQAIGVLGVLLARVLSDKSGDKYLLSTDTKIALNQLLELARNETTRLAAFKALHVVGEHSLSVPFDEAWFSEICFEAASNLRKADRAIRMASLVTLRTLVLRHAQTSKITKSKSAEVGDVLQSLLVSEDVSMLAQVLSILAALARAKFYQITPDLTFRICQLLQSPNAGSLVDQLCDFMTAVSGDPGAQQLMTAILNDVGIGSSPAVVGKVIGTLLVSASGQIKVSVKDFLKELQSAKDDVRKSLALAILGEAGFRSSGAELSPDLFVRYFKQGSDVALTAAIALGRASAGQQNLSTWVPVLLTKSKHQEDKYLLLHSVKELLAYAESDSDLLPYTDNLWTSVVASSHAEANRAMGAECLGNLALIDAAKYMPALKDLLKEEDENLRGTAILAFRDIFTSSDDSYDKYLRPGFVEVLTVMMHDENIENRRLSLNTFNAAIRSKPSLVLPQLATLVPLVIGHTQKDVSLMREVPMGPFRHTVDDGLEIRKNAYESVYALVDAAPRRLDITSIYDRVVAGVNDDRGIQTLCLLLTSKLALIAPEESLRRLDSLSDEFTNVLAFKPKENAVRQETERADDAKKDVIKVALRLNELFAAESAGTVKWTPFFSDMKKTYETTLLREVERDLREAQRT